MASASTASTYPPPRLPKGGATGLSRSRNANTIAHSGEPRFTGWCLEKHDLCAAKLCAFREKDRNFVNALLDAQLIDACELAERLSQVPDHFTDLAAQARRWLYVREPADNPGS